MFVYTEKIKVFTAHNFPQYTHCFVLVCVFEYAVPTPTHFHSYSEEYELFCYEPVNYVHSYSVHEISSDILHCM